MHANIYGIWLLVYSHYADCVDSCLKMNFKQGNYQQWIYGKNQGPMPNNPMKSLPILKWRMLKV